MIVNEGMYHVNAIDIANTAKKVAIAMRLNGMTEDHIRSLLRIYAMVIDEVSAYNDIPWTSMAEWTACVNALNNDHTLQSVMREASDMKQFEVEWPRVTNEEQNQRDQSPA